MAPEGGKQKGYQDNGGYHMGQQSSLAVEVLSMTADYSTVVSFALFVGVKLVSNLCFCAPPVL